MEIVTILCNAERQSVDLISKIIASKRKKLLIMVIMVFPTKQTRDCVTKTIERINK